MARKLRRIIRIRDRELAASAGLMEDERRRVTRNQDERPSVEEKIDHYRRGGGWQKALEWANEALAGDMPIKDVALGVGWSEEELVEAIRTQIAPSAEELPKRRERPCRTVRQRVKALTGVNKKIMKRAKRLYEVEFMTVREVSDTISEPYEKTYLILNKAGTKFRRPGRRPSR